jgi:alpha-tubulin suppressor-like RCC1 family protein
MRSRLRQVGIALGLASLASFTLGAKARADSRIRGVASNVIAAGSTHALLVEHGRSDLVWGADGVSTKTIPAFLPGFGQVAAGTKFSLGIDLTGHLYGWGLNSNHQTGSSGGTPVSSPTQIGSGNTWKWVAAGATHGLAITGGGALYAWGQNSDGELGQNNTSSYIVAPTPVAASARWLAASGGNQFSVAIQANGSAWSWGHNASGQLGNGNTTAQHVPVPITSTIPWVAVSAGDSHVLGIKGDGSLWAWGLNDQGQLGCGTCTSPQKTPVAVTSPAGQWIAVSAGQKSSYALRSDGTLWAWGYNNKGQVGNNSTTSQTTPTQIGSGFQYVAAGADFAVAVTTDGSVWSWGNNASNQLGNGNTTSTKVPARMPDSANGSIRGVKPALLIAGANGSASAYSAAHLKTSGVLETWGSISNGPLGLGATLPNGVKQTNQSCDTGSSVCWGPIPVMTTQPFVQASSSASRMVAIRGDGSLWAWGGTQSVPVQISAAATTWVKISNQWSALVAIRADGTLWTWNGTFGSALTQLCTSGACAGFTWATVASGGEASLAVSTDGTLWGWGSPSDGDLLNDTMSRAAPEKIAPYGPAGWPTTWLDVQSSQQDVSAVDTNGTLWGWGYDPYGDIGAGIENDLNAPIRTPAAVLNNVVSVGRCGDSAMAMDVQSNLFVWGENEAGELGNVNGTLWATNATTGYIPGNGSTDFSAAGSEWNYLPGPVLSMACGGGSSFVEDNESGVWAAGDDTYGELGFGYPGSRSFQFGAQPAQSLYPDAVDPAALSASVNNATAGNVNTGNSWTTSPTKQAAGQWFEMDLGTATYLSGVWLIAPTSTTFPVAFSVSVSIDNSHWTTVPATSGTGQYMSIMFPVQWARYVRITLTGSSTNVWSISTMLGEY